MKPPGRLDVFQPCPYLARPKVGRYAEEMKNYEASRRFSVSQKLIRDWRKAEASRMWEWAHWDSRDIDMGVPPKFSELEKELFAYIDESRCISKAVVVLMLTKRPVFT